MRNRIMSILLVIAILAGGMYAAPLNVRAQSIGIDTTTGTIPLTNTTFEGTQGLNGWTSSGKVSVVTSFYHEYTIQPFEGTQMALLQADQMNVPATLSQSFLITQDDINAGTNIVTGWACFGSLDYTPYNDRAQVAVKNNTAGTPAEIIYQSDVTTVGGAARGAWKAWHYIAILPGNYTLTANVVNITDSKHNSVLAIDDINSTVPISPVYYLVADSPYNGSVVVTADGETVDPDRTYFSPGTVLTLNAVPNSGYVFTSWDGDLTSSNSPETLTMDSDKHVQAYFDVGAAPAVYTLDIYTDGHGTAGVQTNGTPIYPVDSSATPLEYNIMENTPLNLAATPNSGYTFSSWGGDVVNTSANTATLTMDGPKTVYASFDPVQTMNGPYPLSIVIVPAGMGTISVSSNNNPVFPDDSNYPNKYTIPDQTPITLLASPGDGYQFSNWSGNIISTDANTSFNMNAPMTVYANFIPIPPPVYIYLDVKPHDGGSVAVYENSSPVTPPDSSNPNQYRFDHSDNVTLIATPDPGYIFSHWDGALTGDSRTSTLLVDNSKTVDAYFDHIYTLTIQILNGSGDVTVKNADTNAATDQINPGVYAILPGTNINLSAAATPGYSLSYLLWNNRTQTNEPSVDFTMNGDNRVGVYFTQDEYTLTVNSVPSGTVTPFTQGITYHYGDNVTLQAQPAARCTFVGWTGTITINGVQSAITSASNPFEVTMHGNTTLTANYVQNSTSTALSISANPTVYGQPAAFTADVTGDPSGIILTGSVIFTEGNTNLGDIALTNGQATISNVILTAGTHIITAVYNGDGNYPPSASQPISLNLDKANPVVTWATPAPITYGTALGIAQLDAGTSFKGNPLPGAFTYIPATGEVLDYGTRTLNVTFVPADSDNFNSSTASVNLVVNKSLLTVKADNKTMTAGQTVPDLTYSITGFMNGENGSVVGGSPLLTPGANEISLAGSYPVNIAQGSLHATNYNFTLTPGTLTVTGLQTPVITWNDPAAITYGTALGGTQLNATASFHGSSVAGTLTYTPAAGMKLKSGTQELDVTFTPTDNRYDSATANVHLTVSKALLTVKADNKTMTVGQALPTLTYTVTGFVNGETIAAINGDPELSTTATSATPAGTYPIAITRGSLDAANYDFTLSGGTLTVNNFTTYKLTLSYDSCKGTVTATPAPGQDGKYTSGTVVSLQATAKSSYKFDHWMGPLSGNTNPGSITMDGDKSVTAVFTSSCTPKYLLEVDYNRSYGTVTLNPPSQYLRYDPGTVVTLTATPKSGYTFTGWSGVDTSNGLTATVTMNGERDVTATFIRNSSNYKLSLNYDACKGSVTASPSSKYYNYAANTTVTLTATPKSGYTFTGWSGADTSNGLTGTVTMNSNKTVTATFAKSSGSNQTYKLTLDSDTKGSIDATPDGDRNNKYPDGTVVTLTATAKSGYTFTDWSGDLSGTQNPTTVVMDSNKSIDAVFTRGYTLTASVSGHGSTVKSPDQDVYPANTQVTLTATADSGYVFFGWMGDLSSSDNPATIKMTDNKTVTAVFGPVPTPASQAFKSLIVDKMMINWYEGKGKNEGNGQNVQNDKFQAWGRLQLPDGVTLANLQSSATVTLTISNNSGNSGSDTFTMDKVQPTGNGTFWMQNSNDKNLSTGANITDFKIWWAPDKANWSGWAGFHINGTFQLPNTNINKNTKPTQAVLTITVPTKNGGKITDSRLVTLQSNNNQNLWSFNTSGSSPNFPYNIDDNDD